MFDDLRAAIQPEIIAISRERAMALSDEVGVSFDPTIINTEALDWARDYSYQLIGGITDTTRELVRGAQQTFIETPGMTRADLEKMLQPAFGESRASTIAVTETTRAYSEAVNRQQAMLANSGIEMRRVWQTNNDSIVCPICGPLNGLPEEDWRDVFPLGPPQPHPNCRCSLTLSSDSVSSHRADAKVRAGEREKMLEEERAREEAARARP